MRIDDATSSHPKDVTRTDIAARPGVTWTLRLVPFTPSAAGHWVGGTLVPR